MPFEGVKPRYNIIYGIGITDPINAFILDLININVFVYKYIQSTLVTTKMNKVLWVIRIVMNSL